MATVNMDRLLQACVTQNATDIHLTVGRAPVFRIHCRLRPLETKVLEPDDRKAAPILVLLLEMRRDFVYLFLSRKEALR